MVMIGIWTHWRRHGHQYRNPPRSGPLKSHVLLPHEPVCRKKGSAYEPTQPKGTVYLAYNPDGFGVLLIPTEKRRPVRVRPCIHAHRPCCPIELLSSVTNPSFPLYKRVSNLPRKRLNVSPSLSNR